MGKCQQNTAEQTYLSVWFIADTLKNGKNTDERSYRATGEICKILKLFVETN